MQREEERGGKRRKEKERGGERRGEEGRGGEDRKARLALRLRRRARGTAIREGGGRREEGGRKEERIDESCYQCFFHEKRMA